MIQVVTEKPPVPAWPAVTAVTTCVVRTAVLLYRRRIHLPRHNVGQRLRFANGTIGAFYRETVVDRGPTRRPAVLVVGFQLRLLRGRGHALFRLESILNTPLFVGFPGFVSKLWLAHDGHTLHTLLAVPGVHLLLQADADEPDRARLDPRVHVHRLADRPGRGLLVVRPDGYVGFRLALLDQDQLGKWLGLIGLPERASASGSGA